MHGFHTHLQAFPLLFFLKKICVLLRCAFGSSAPTLARRVGAELPAGLSLSQAHRSEVEAVILVVALGGRC